MSIPTRDITMRDVARHAGVSIKTVSRVINNQGEISEATRQHVLTIIQKLDYRPNSLARGLVSGKTLSVALIIPDITDPFYPETVLGVESVAREFGYSVFLCNTNNDPQQELKSIDVLSGKQVDGIIICGTWLSKEQLSDVANRHPVTILTSRIPAHSAGISIPSIAGVSQLTSHLIDLGHRAIGHIAASPQRGGERVLGYQQALKLHDLPYNPNHVVTLPRVSIGLAHQAARELLIRQPELTAISCYNDLVAIGVLQAAHDLGRRVPHDLATVGFDDIPLASLITPKLTSMHVPRFELGQMLMQMLLRVIAADGRHQEQLETKLELVVRESCGALLAEKPTPPAG